MKLIRQFLASVASLMFGIVCMYALFQDKKIEHIVGAGLLAILFQLYSQEK